VDLAGRVVGINELGAGGMGFAIPSSIASDVLDQALEKGRVDRGWLGFSVLPVQKIGRTDGALVSNVLEGETAEKAGLRAGDVLVSLDGEPVTVRFFEEVPDLYRRIAALAIGSEVALGIDRNGRRESLAATVAEMPPFRGREEEIRELGITAEEITRPMAISRQLPSTDGLLITGVRPGGAADDAKPRLSEGDVLLSLDGDPVQALDGLRTAVEAKVDADAFVVALWRNDQEILAVVPPRKGSSSGWGGELPKAWLGLRTQVLTPDLARALGVEGRTGYRITQVLPWTAASEGGLEVGDLLVAVDDEPLEANRPQDSEDLRRVVEELTIGESARLTVLRSGEERVVPVRLEARPRAPEEADKVEQEELEFHVRELTFMDRIENDWSRRLQGVLVVDATMGGWGHMAGLRLGDLIVEINDRPVPDVEAFQSVMGAILEERPEVVKLFVRRKERTHFVLIEPDWDELLVPVEDAA
jgi:serine protease Do